MKDVGVCHTEAKSAGTPVSISSGTSIWNSWGSSSDDTGAPRLAGRFHDRTVGPVAATVETDSEDICVLSGLPAAEKVPPRPAAEH
ncbi:hypothetical protein GCM10027063_31880 [Promicromonospora xylanilytica]